MSQLVNISEGQKESSGLGLALWERGSGETRSWLVGDIKGNEDVLQWITMTVAPYGTPWSCMFVRGFWVCKIHLSKPLNVEGRDSGGELPAVPLAGFP